MTREELDQRELELRSQLAALQGRYREEAAPIIKEIVELNNIKAPYIFYPTDVPVPLMKSETPER